MLKFSEREELERAASVAIVEKLRELLPSQDFRVKVKNASDTTCFIIHTRWSRWGGKKVGVAAMLFGGERSLKSAAALSRR